MKPLCIYHGNCADGFGAAWVLWKHFEGNIDFFPGVYQKPPPRIERDRDVFFVDFSYKQRVMWELGERSRQTLILDHHKTAEADLSAWKTTRFLDYRSMYLEMEDTPFMMAIFDMNRSGAGLTWDFFNPGKPRPALINHIEDRDLWRFLLPKTREIQASMFSLPYNFQVWDDRFQNFEDLLPEIINEGIAIERKHFKDIEELCAVSTRPMKFATRLNSDGKPFDTVIVPSANLPYTMAADAGHLLCGCDLYGVVDPVVRQPFAACYFDKPNGRQFSLRSADDGMDVGEIATLYGGGGHKHASGFTVPYYRLSEFEP